MPPASPRKSSTSSGRRPRTRARYLGVEVAGEPVPSGPSLRWTAWLDAALAAAGAPRLPFRLVRSEGYRTVVRVVVADAPAARRAWDGVTVPGTGLRLRTAKTWGTMLGAKAWLERARTAGRAPRPLAAQDPTSS
jgi:hypothetical protein